MNYTLKPPKVGGSEQLRLFVDDIGLTRAAKIIGVTPLTMRRWTSDTGKPPVAVVQSLYWLTRWGFSDAASEVDQVHHILMARIRELETALAWRAPAGIVAANEPSFTEPPHAGMAAPWWSREERRFSF